MKTVAADQLTITWQAASLLLDYPDQELARHLDVIRAALPALPRVLAEPLADTVAQLASGNLSDLQTQYVDTFDNRRRHTLYLTYFAHGDTRRRGVALLRFKQTYLRSGFVLDESELPDHLCVVLEYAATVDQHLGRRLLIDHRAGLELLRLALADAESPWHGAVQAVTATLPPLAGDERQAIARLAAEGPPQEEVGLTPYATPTSLPMPTFPGGPR
ncbi:nitrate reductase molybdenum cofactor assembly chaperone [Kribbella sp. NPDC000426]|uniref:nitrate reductase molybdenum cofactor assembly chaperone n=1 Tax=Kribbella sp. NPDC000426 TaxID=3154255 RepID=UPI00332A6403